MPALICFQTSEVKDKDKTLHCPGHRFTTSFADPKTDLGGEQALPDGLQGLWKPGAQCNLLISERLLPPAIRPGRPRPNGLPDADFGAIDYARSCTECKPCSSPRYTRPDSLNPLTGGRFDSRIHTVRQARSDGLALGGFESTSRPPVPPRVQR
jgi:hypothetical protein